MKQIYLFLLIVTLCSSITDEVHWSAPTLNFENIQNFFRILPKPSEPLYTAHICHHCFNVSTYNSERKPRIRPCGGKHCVSIVHNTDLDDYDHQTEDYDFSQCGRVDDTHPANKPEPVLKISGSHRKPLVANEFPWLVLIKILSPENSNFVEVCGGTLIHPQWVLTAAHCMFHEKSGQLLQASGIKLYIGHYDRLRRSKNKYVRKSALYLMNPKFRSGGKPARPSHDLALIKLAQPVQLSRSINTACLPQPNDRLIDGALAFTAGWGSIGLTSLPRLPRKAKIRISPQSCEQLQLDKVLHICGRNERGYNICSGDSGSGLVIRVGIQTAINYTEWKWHVFGVASYGPMRCSTSANHDNAFASVSIDVKWIQNVIRKY